MSKHASMTTSPREAASIAAARPYTSPLNLVNVRGIRKHKKLLNDQLHQKAMHIIELQNK